MGSRDENDQPYAIAVANAHNSFLKSNSANLDYQAEALFALQACQNNGYLADVANANPFSVSMAMANVAAIGLTLNPVMGLAFLVPRNKKVMLDISYRGLIKLAVDGGSIRWAKAELVYANDTFEYRGGAQEPIHVADVFSRERGEFRGVYCTAKTCEGDYLVEAVSADEINKIRDKSAAYSSDKSSPWKDWFDEMAKKSAIKRASKIWPKSNQRLQEAIELLNTEIKRASKIWPKSNQRLQEAIELLNTENGEGLGTIVASKERPAKSILMEPKKAAPRKSDIEKDVVDLVKKVVDRSINAGGAWSAAKSYVNEKFTGSDLDYALDVIIRAEQAAQPVKNAGGS
jgi:recombination protein RecT